MTILVTGGAGSLGKEFVRLLNPNHQVTVVDNNEWAVAELRSEFPDVQVFLKDFADVTGHYDYVIHCAAYKHVDICEDNIMTCVENNIVSTGKFYRKLGPDTRLLYVSTDKAVEPISVYGMTKAIAERLTWQVGGSVARCGNFLHSSGSVIPVWEKCIRENKPIKITDERMVRYVSKMEDAVKEIWDRFCTGETLIIPEVREVRLLDLLSEVLKKHSIMMPSAYEPGVEIIGMRRGEKLREKLMWDQEGEVNGRRR